MTSDRPRLRHLGIFLADYQGGGAERVMIDLAAGLTDRGVSVDLLVANPRGPYRELVPSDVNLIELNTGGVMRALPRLVQYLRSERPQLLFTTLHHSSVVALTANRLSGTRTPVVVREANTPSRKAPSSRNVKSWLTAQSLRLLYSRASAIVAVSHGVAADLVDHFNLARTPVSVIYNPVVTPNLQQMATEEPEHPWVRESDLPVILGVGRLLPQKDFENLIRAFALVRRDQPARLLILGEGDERERLEGLADELGLSSSEIDLPGFVTNPFAYMSRCSVFVLSSRWEGLPGVLIQAMACGSRVISTDCPSGPAEILEGGRLGRLVPTGDPEALARAISHTLASDDADAESDVRLRSQEFSLPKIVDQYIEFFEAQLEQSRGRTPVGAAEGA